MDNKKLINKGSMEWILKEVQVLSAAQLALEALEEANATEVDSTTKDLLKSYFVDTAKPTGQHFSDVIDAMVTDIDLYNLIQVLTEQINTWNGLETTSDWLKVANRIMGIGMGTPSDAVYRPLDGSADVGYWTTYHSGMRQGDNEVGNTCVTSGDNSTGTSSLFVGSNIHKNFLKLKTGMTYTVKYIVYYITAGTLGCGSGSAVNPFTTQITGINNSGPQFKVLTTINQEYMANFQSFQLYHSLGAGQSGSAEWSIEIFEGDLTTTFTALGYTEVGDD